MDDPQLEQLDDNALYELLSESRSHLGGLLLRQANDAEVKGEDDMARLSPPHRRIPSHPA